MTDFPLASIPFIGLLVSIALLPALLPRFWQRRTGVVGAGWAGLTLALVGLQAGPALALSAAWTAILTEYLPFIAPLAALYTVAGGVLVRGGPFGTAAGNTLLLAVGTALAGMMGTTGASLVLVHPLLRANAHRQRKAHLVLFLIILVANAGGATSPLGDPPLYLGYLHGVPFLWPLHHLGPSLLAFALPVLGVFYLLDRRLARADGSPPPYQRLHLRGWGNLVLIAVIVATAFVQGVWPLGEIVLGGAAIGRERLAAVAVFLVAGGLSVVATPRAVRQDNLFVWHPIVEIAKLFAALFVTIGPVLEVLSRMAPPPGTLDPLCMFWVAGLFSAFLDNAPTYFAFFQLLGGNGPELASQEPVRLAAISVGSVLFGGLTYIGNAPNLLIAAIAAHRGVRMPSFLGYATLAGAVMSVPLFLVCVLFFAGLF